MKNPHLAIIRLAHPLAVAGYLRHMGAPEARYLSKQGLPTLCEDPNVFVPIHKTWLFFEDAAALATVHRGFFHSVQRAV